jgi:uncharacterized membrane protein
MIPDGIIASSIILVLSVIYFAFQPKSINGLYGYRTPMSRKSDKHWQFANKLASKILLFGSISIFVFSAFAEFVVQMNSQNLVLIFFVACFLLTMSVVEIKLRRL